MKRWCLALLLLLPVWAQAEDAPRDIRLASEVWRDYTNTDGSGLAWDIMRKVFEPAGIAVQTHSVPYTRAVGLVQRGESDAWVGAYRDEVSDRVFFPKMHYDSDRIVALGLRDKPVPTLDTLSKYRLVWVRGYGYEEYLPNVHRYQEIQRRSGILGMLDLGHADFYIDARPEVEELLQETPEPQRYRINELTKLPLFLGFSDTPRGHQLAAVYDQRLKALIESGELKSVFARWRQPYPFD